MTNSGDCTVVVTNIAGAVTSSVATLTVVASPEITVQPTPTNQSLAVRSTATLTVTALGTMPLHYQWKLNGTNVAMPNGHIIGATTNVLVISNAQTTNSGDYTVVVTNIPGSVTSSNAYVTVTNILPSITSQPTSGSAYLEHKFGVKRVGIVLKYFERWGTGILALSSLIPFPFPTSAFFAAAGVLNYPARQFVTVVAVARAGRYFALALLASLYGRQFIHTVRHPGEHAGWFLLIACLACVLAAGGLFVQQSVRRQTT